MVIDYYPCIHYPVADCLALLVLNSTNPGLIANRFSCAAIIIWRLYVSPDSFKQFLINYFE